MDVIFSITLLLFISSVLANPLPENEHFKPDDHGATNNSIKNPHVDYMVLVDYRRDYLIIKNTTSQMCLYSPLDMYEFLKDEKLNWEKRARQNDFPVVATEEVAENVFLSWEDASVRLEKLPGSYKLAKQCFGLPSYRMIHDGSNRDRRSSECGCVCGSCCGCCCIQKPPPPSSSQ